MSIDQLNRILYDMYQMDVQPPPIIGTRDQAFRKASYTWWAVDEFRNYIQESLAPRTSASIDEMARLALGFMMKMSRFSKKNPKAAPVFQTAYDVSLDILDLLRAMA